MSVMPKASFLGVGCLSVEFRRIFGDYSQNENYPFDLEAPMFLFKTNKFFLNQLLASNKIDILNPN
jgi:hypothetical protein